MPLLTPSRVLLAVLSLSFFGLLWNFGMPHAGHAGPRPAIHLDGSTGPPLAAPRIPDKPAKVEGPKEEEQKVVLGPVEEDDSVDAGETKRPGSTTADTVCHDARGAQDVMIVVKMSKAELSSGKLPSHLATLLACAPHVAIFSDHVGTVEQYTVHDALDTINATLREKYSEFREYAKMQADKSYLPSVDKAQKLDKWKYLPMVYNAYKTNPSLRYYLFIETDVTLSWTNLLQWLARLDYRIPYYSGAPMFHGDTKYAQQGAGILVSFGAMRYYAKMYDERYAHEWEPHIGGECCGDILLATAMTASHVEMAPSWPMLQGESPASLDWTEKHWCTPIISWHGANAQEIDMLWDAQMKWTRKNGWEVPYLARNAFEDSVLPRLEVEKEDWDNVSSDTVIKGDPEKKKEQLAKEKENDKKQASPSPSPSPSPESQARTPEIDSESNLPPPTPSPTPKTTPSPAANTKRIPRAQAIRRDPPAPDPDSFKATIATAADSASNCRTVCTKTDDCIQWKYSPTGVGECHLGKVLRLGRKTGDSGDAKDGGQDGNKKGPWTSGWILDRVKEKMDAWGRCEESKVRWGFHQ